MAPRNKDFEQNEVVQAIIIGESFDNQFDPVTREMHKLLIPVVNTPLLDYSLDWLYRSGVEEVILYCRATPFGPSIKQHCKSLVQRRQWTHQLSVRVVASDEVRSVGDALRDAYTRSFIDGDFLLMRGDTLGNVDLKQMLQVHKANKKRDCKTTMTCLFTPPPPPESSSTNAPFPPDISARTEQDELPTTSSHRVSTITDANGKILYYERARRGTKLKFPSSLAYTAPRLLLSPHLPDPSITVCSQDVPALFADNFDCMTRDSLIRGLVQPDDLNECSVYQYIPRRGYATTLVTWGDYERISIEVCTRRLFPQCPHASLTTGRQRYLRPPYTDACYTRSGGQAGPGGWDRVEMRLPRVAVYGDATEVSPDSYVTRSVLGNMCRVASGVWMRSVFVGDNCTVEPGVVARSCYLGNNVTLLPDTVLEPGCVVTSDVTLGPNVTLTRASLVVSKAVYDALDDFDKDDKPVVLPGGGYLFPRLGGDSGATDGSDDSDDELSTPAAPREAAAPCMSGFTTDPDGVLLPVWGLQQDDYDHHQPCSSGSTSAADADEVDAAAAAAADEDLDMDEDEIKEQQFFHEVMDSLVDGLREKTDSAKVALEINGSRYAYNVTLETMQTLVLKGVLLCHEEHETRTKFHSQSSPWPSWSSCRLGLLRYTEVLKRYLRSGDDFLGTMERLVEMEEKMLSCAVKLLYELTQNMEVLDDETLLSWFKRGGNNNKNPTQAFGKLSAKVSDFLAWVENAEEESSEEDED